MGVVVELSLLRQALLVAEMGCFGGLASLRNATLLSKGDFFFSSDVFCWELCKMRGYAYDEQLSCAIEFC